MRCISVCLCVVIALVGGICRPAQAELTWETETVHSTGDVGKYTSLAVDSSDNPHISYYDETNFDLKYATKNGLWAYGTPDDGGKVRPFSTSIELWSDNPRVSYGAYTGFFLDHLYYVAHDGESWGTPEQADGSDDVGSDSSLALDSSGNPAISYQGSLKYVERNGSWGTPTTVDSPAGANIYTSLALDGSDRPHVSYYDSTGGDLKFAWNYGEWVTTPVDTTDTVGLYTSLAVDPSGKAHISYYDSTNGALKYTLGTFSAVGGWSWDTKTVDNGGVVGDNVGQWTSLALAGSRPAISYYNATDGDLMCAYKSAAGWVIETADGSANDVGSYSSVGWDSNGNVHISYYDATDKNLKYAVGTPEPTTTVLALVSLAFGGFYAARRKKKNIPPET